MSGKIKELVFMSKSVGCHPAYVQGGGGNTSIKMNRSQMAIKSSGKALAEMTEEDGYSIVDYQSIRTNIKYLRDIIEKSDKKQGRPSMEAGFHALLGDYVIHTHSVYVNLLTCSKEGQQIASQLFQEALWLDYVTPGEALAEAVQKLLQEKPFDEGIIFLGNHGVIVVGKTAQETLNSHEHINRQIQKFFQLSENAFEETTHSLKNKDMEFMKKHVLFPDQVVYAFDQNLQTVSARQTLQAYHFILHHLKEKQWTPRFLSPQQINVLLNMESEKYRQKQTR